MKSSDREKDAPGTTATAEQEPAAPPQTPEQIAAAAAAISAPPPAPAANGKALVPAKASVPVRMGVAPANLDEAWRMAQFIAASELVPKNYRGRPSDVLVAIQFGMEVGLPPMAALHSIFVTNGRPGLWGDGFLAVIMASPVYKDHDEYYMVDGARREFLVSADLGKDDTMAVTTFWRSDSARPRTATFSIGKAKKAGLWTKEGPWQTYPDRMLKFRARGFAGRDAFPEVLRGIQTVEELRDNPPEIIDSTPVPEVRRMSETALQEANDLNDKIRKDTDQPPAGTPVNAKPAASPLEQPDEAITIGPVRVLEVEQFLGGFTVSLSSGQKIDLTDAGEAVELEQFKGTKHAIRLVCTKPDRGNLVLRSFSIAD